MESVQHQVSEIALLERVWKFTVGQTSDWWKKKTTVYHSVLGNKDWVSLNHALKIYLKCYQRHVIKALDALLK